MKMVSDVMMAVRAIAWLLMWGLHSGVSLLCLIVGFDLDRNSIPL
jgi:hypothetical protein